MGRWTDELLERFRDADRGDGLIEPALQGREVGTRVDARILVLGRRELPESQHPTQGRAPLDQLTFAPGDQPLPRRPGVARHLDT